MQLKVLNNRYELEQKIGEGGMARVYRGRDGRLNRRVAVKVLHPHHASDVGFLQRFHHEAQAAANLHHPNIVDVYDVGQDDGVHYIVMEYVEGSDLKSLILRNGALPPEQAVPIAIAVAEGLEAAHRLGMVHRDVKPQNIIVGPAGQVKITDFGIAKSSLSTAMTETGVTFGTADYISPEQAQGLQATARSDVYSLGVTLYEMLTGRLPFTGDSSVAVAMQHVSSEPPPPRMLNARIPLQLEALVLRALAKRPEERPASAREFARLLRSYQTVGEQETLVRPVAQHPAQRPSPRPAANGGAVSRGATGPMPRAPLPPPRPAVAAPAPTTGAGRDFGVFLLGLLLLGVILVVVYILATVPFGDLFGSASGRPRPTEAPAATDVAATPSSNSLASNRSPNCRATPTRRPTPSQRRARCSTRCRVPASRSPPLRPSLMSSASARRSSVYQTSSPCAGSMRPSNCATSACRSKRSRRPIGSAQASCSAWSRGPGCGCREAKP
jgi:eukaryotic-like serine/threonine-protein kinase